MSRWYYVAVALFFVGFALFELIKRLPIHPLQYQLVGLALAIFFLLLLIFSVVDVAFTTPLENQNLTSGGIALLYSVLGIVISATAGEGGDPVFTLELHPDGTGTFTILGVPEGTFKLFAYDYDTGRMAFGPPNLFISKVVQEHTDLVASIRAGKPLNEGRRMADSVSPFGPV